MENKYTQNLGGYILAGGKSSRMGQDKGLMIFDGKTIIERIIDQLKPVTGRVVIVSNNSDYEQFGCEVIPDQIKDIGPAGGIHAALNHSKHRLNIVVSCDSPFISKKAIEFMIQKSGNSQITVPKHGEHIEPLFGVYSTECRTVWNELVQNNNRKLHDIISKFETNYIDVDHVVEFQPPFFLNINTENDFKTALKLVHYDN